MDNSNNWTSVVFCERYRSTEGEMAVKVMIPEQIALTSQDSLSEGYDDEMKQKESGKKTHVQFADVKEPTAPSSPSSQQASAPTLMVAVKRERL